MIFDGPNRLIQLEASDGDSVSAQAIYSRWKDWTQGGAGLQWPEAFSTIGGEDLGGGLKAGAYFFLQTQYGWQVRPRDAAHDLTIVGNLFPAVAGQDLFASTVSAHNVSIRLQTSSLTQTSESGGGASAAAIADAVWARVFGSGRTAQETLARAERDAGISVAVSV